MRTSSLISAALIIYALFMQSCGHYQLQGTGELPFRTLYVTPLENNTFAPQVVSVMTQQLIYTLQRARGIEIVSSPKDADATLTVNLVDYEQQTSTTQENDTVLAQSFTISFEALTSLVNNRTKQYYLDNQEVFSSREVFTTGGYQVALYQAMPVLTQDLVYRIRDQVISVW